MITSSINWIRLRLMLPKSRWKWLKSRWQWLKIGRCFERLRPDLMRWNMQSWNLLHHTLISHFRNHMVNSHINVHTRYASYTCIKIHFLFNIFTSHSNTYIFGPRIWQVPPSFGQSDKYNSKPLEYNASDKGKTPTYGWEKDFHDESIWIMTKPPNVSLFGRQLKKSHLLCSPYTIPSPKRRKAHNVENLLATEVIDVDDAVLVI